MSTNSLVAVCNTLLAVFTFVPGAVITTDSMGAVKVYQMFLPIESWRRAHRPQCGI